MPCVRFGDGIVCTPTVTRTKVRFLWCPKCKQKRRVVVRFYEWYAPTATCTAQRLKWAHFEPCGYEWRWEE